MRQRFAQMTDEQIADKKARGWPVGVDKLGRYFYSTAEKAAWDKEGSPDRAPKLEEKTSKQEEIGRRTTQLLRDTKLEVEDGTFLGIGNLDEWTALITLVPADAYPYLIRAYDEDGLHKPYVIVDQSEALVIVGRGSALRATITDPEAELLAAVSAASTKGELDAVADVR